MRVKRPCSRDFRRTKSSAPPTAPPRRHLCSPMRRNRRRLRAKLAELKLLLAERNGSARRCGGSWRRCTRRSPRKRRPQSTRQNPRRRAIEEAAVGTRVRAGPALFRILRGVSRQLPSVIARKGAFITTARQSSTPASSPPGGRSGPLPNLHRPPGPRDVQNGILPNPFGNPPPGV